MIKFDFENYVKDIYKKQKFDINELTKKIENNDMTGWLSQDYSQIDEIINLAQEIRKNNDCIVIIGIGGSYMGSYALNKVFSKYFTNDSFEIIHAGYNLDENYMNELLEYLKNKNFAINVISKSGNTLEISSCYTKILSLMKEKYNEQELKEKIIITTDKESGKLREEVNKYGYKSFVVPDDIGGRYSVLTPVGLFPLALNNVDIKKLLDGANDGMNLKEKAFEYATIRNNMFNNNKYIENFSVYEEKLYYFTEWIKQLFGETEGKNKTGIFPISTVNTRDLHSLGQFLQDGNPIIFETVISKIENSINESAIKGVCIAHSNDTTPALRIMLSEFDEYNIGQLVFFFFMAASYSAFMFDVNPYNQPGVESYKKEIKKQLNK